MTYRMTVEELIKILATLSPGAYVYMVDGEPLTNVTPDARVNAVFLSDDTSESED